MFSISYVSNQEFEKKKKTLQILPLLSFCGPEKGSPLFNNNHIVSSIVNLQSRIVKVGDMSKTDGTPASYFISSLTCHHSHSRLCALTTGSEWRVYLALLQFLGTLS